MRKHFIQMLVILICDYFITVSMFFFTYICYVSHSLLRTSSASFFTVAWIAISIMQTLITVRAWKELKNVN